MRSAPAVEWSELSSTDASLVERCVAGDEDACRALVEAHEQMVFRLAFALTGEREEALDVSQEVFLRVFRTLRRFRGEAAIRTWIYRIVVNQARNRHRWWRRRGRAAQVSFDDFIRSHGEPRSAAGVSPDACLDQRRLAVRLRAVVARLPFDQRSTLVLREYHGLPYQEIAYSLGVTLGTVKSRLARARATIRTEMRGAWPT